MEICHGGGVSIYTTGIGKSHTPELFLFLFYLESWLLEYYQHTTDFLCGASGWVTFKQETTSTVEERGHHLISKAKS